MLDIIEETHKDIKKVGKSKRSLRFRSLVFVLAPLVFIGSGLVVGKHLSNKHDMYATITRNIDLKTGAVIGEVKKSYNQLELDYEATVTAYGPWRVDNTGNGYLRDVINYTYIPSRELGETYYPTMDNLEGHIREKNRYIETKKELDENDSMTDVVMQVKETYQDRSDTRKSIIPTITLIYVGLVLGVGIDIILCFEGVLDMLHIKHQVEHLRSCLQDDKEIMEAAKIQLALLESKYYYLKEKNDRLFKKYGVRVEMPTYSGGKQI